MAEKLCSLKKIGGGGSSIDYANPDKISSGVLNVNASVNIATTKKARLIVAEWNIKISADNTIRRLMVFEVGKGGTQIYINGSGTLSQYSIDANGVVSGGIGTVFTVTDNNVNMANTSSTVNSYYIIAIYY